MDSEQWKRLDDVLQSALDLVPEERDAFLRHACAGDETLEREVRALLTSEKHAGRFLENPAIEVAARAIVLKDEAPETPGFRGDPVRHCPSCATAVPPGSEFC